MKCAFVADTLSRFVELVPVCPEVESGMPVPRESLRLVSSKAGLRLMANRSGADHTERMASFAEQRIAELAALALDGFVLKKDSPSCGLERVRTHGEGPLLLHHLRRHEVSPWLSRQPYFQPYPKELGAR